MDAPHATGASAVEETVGHARQTGDLLETDKAFAGRSSETPVTASLVPEVIAETFSTWEAATSSTDVPTTSATQRGDARSDAATTRSEPITRTEPVARAEPVAQVEPAMRPEPAAPREAATRPEPTTRPEPSARPEPVVYTEPAGRNDAAQTSKDAVQTLKDAVQTSKDSLQTSTGAAGGAAASRLGGQGVSDGGEPLRRRRTAAIVEDNLRPRVERLRDASVSMLDDASEDSGLRFVLIAVALFLLFLLFLFLNNILR